MKQQLSIDDLNQHLERDFAPQQRKFEMQIRKLGPNEIRAQFEATKESMLRPGNIVSGPTMMMAVDVTAYLLIRSRIGLDADLVTTHMSVDFIRACRPGTLSAAGSLLRTGKRHHVCQVHLFNQDQDVIVSAGNATFARL